MILLNNVKEGYIRTHLYTECFLDIYFLYFKHREVGGEATINRTFLYFIITSVTMPSPPKGALIMSFSL